MPPFYTFCSECGYQFQTDTEMVVKCPLCGCVQM